jgi:hypothetical protein
METGDKPTDTIIDTKITVQYIQHFPKKLQQQQQIQLRSSGNIPTASVSDDERCVSVAHTVRFGLSF